MKNNKNNYILYLLFLLILGFSFYLYSIRCNIIKKNCYNYVAFSTDNKKNLKYINKDIKLDVANSYFKNKYLTIIDEATLPKFYNYDDEYAEFNSDKFVPIIFNSSDDKYYREQIQYIYDQGPNFAQHYAIVNIPCGTGIQCYDIVDYVNGKIYSGKGMYPIKAGIDYNVGSSMIIVNPPDEVRKVFGSDFDKIPDDVDTRYYIWKNNKFKLIKKRRMTTILIGK